MNITVTDVNEPPAIDGDAAVTSVQRGWLWGYRHSHWTPTQATDPEETATTAWSVAGADGSKFDISDGGALTFKDKPDYEMPTDTNKDNVYEVTVRAADADGYIGTKAVKVTVTNVERGRGGDPVEDPATSWYSGNGERYRPRWQHIRPNLAVEYHWCYLDTAGRI